MTQGLLNKNTSAGNGEDIGSYLREIRAIPMLAPEEEKALAMACRAGDESAIRKMVNANLRLVVSVAKEYSGRGVPLLDLIQEGSLGLIIAARRFDYTLDTKFSTYATKWIRQRISRYFVYQAALIRVPQHTGDKIKSLLYAREHLQQELGRMPTLSEMAEACAIAEEKAAELLRLVPEICSLDAPAGEDATLGALLEDHYSPSPQEVLVRQELEQTLEQLLDMLTERQRMILRLHFGMEDGICYSLEDISIRYGVSRERIRQIERQAMNRLKELGANLGLEDFLE
jgi:RNA polymerase primary sigma factor